MTPVSAQALNSCIIVSRSTLGIHSGLMLGASALSRAVAPCHCTAAPPPCITRRMLQGQLFFCYEDEPTPTFLATMEEIDKASTLDNRVERWRHSRSHMACGQQGKSWVGHKYCFESMTELLFHVGRLAFSPTSCAGQRRRISWQRTRLA